jgi:REP element-mobilizing transposase RayT
MPRQPRGTIYPGTYHVWRRTAGPIEMFRDDDDRTLFCNGLARAVEKMDWRLIAFVLMPTHFHLIVDVDQDTLQPGMQRIFGCYAQQFNLRWARTGHLKAGPYKIRTIHDDDGLVYCARYVARNPVRAGLCERPQDWVWSSYPGSAGYSRAFPFVDDRKLLGSFHEDPERARRLLRLYVEAD